MNAKKRLQHKRLVARRKLDRARAACMSPDELYYIQYGTTADIYDVPVKKKMLCTYQTAASDYDGSILGYTRKGQFAKKKTKKDIKD